MRQRRAAGESLKFLAEAFGIIPEYVSYVATAKIYKDVGGPIAKPVQFSAKERKIDLDGICLSETKSAELVEIPLSALKSRLSRGWFERDALSVPLRTAPSEILIPPGPSITYVALNKGELACIDVETIPLAQD